MLQYFSISLSTIFLPGDILNVFNCRFIMLIQATINPIQVKLLGLTRGLQNKKGLGIDVQKSQGYLKVEPKCELKATLPPFVT